MLIFRLAGRRTMAQMTSFDFVLLLIISEATQNAMIGDDYSLTNGGLVVLILVGLDVPLSHVKRWYPVAEKCCPFRRQHGGAGTDSPCR
jgi:uncharacterized membrane protein YcaP (DUF421 family)